jgi:uncharacterized protein
MEALANPFPITGYHGPAYFCDRETECSRLKAAMKNGRNVTLIARRRIGKTSLLHHFAHLLAKEKPAWKVVYVDLMKTNSLRGMYELLASSLFVEHRKSKTLPDLNLMGRLRMTVGVDPLTQLPQAAFDLKENQVQGSLQHLFDWVREQKRMIIAFDEFQRIVDYPEKDVEAFLRSEMQRIPNVRFVYCGSDQHLLQEIFHHNRRPFYQSTESMALTPIDHSVYAAFILGKFRKSNMTVGPEAVDFLLGVTEGETFAVQRLCNALYEMAYPQITVPLVQDTLMRVLDQHQQHYEQVRALLGPNSNLFKVLKAIARLKVVTETYGKDILQSSQIHNASSVNKAIMSLYKYGVITQFVTERGEKGYTVDDALFRIWLSRLTD